MIKEVIGFDELKESYQKTIAAEETFERMKSEREDYLFSTRKKLEGQQKEIDERILKKKEQIIQIKSEVAKKRGRRYLGICKLNMSNEEFIENSEDVEVKRIGDELKELKEKQKELQLEFEKMCNLFGHRIPPFEAPLRGDEEKCRWCGKLIRYR